MEWNTDFQIVDTLMEGGNIDKFICFKEVLVMGAGAFEITGTRLSLMDKR